MVVDPESPATARVTIDDDPVAVGDPPVTDTSPRTMSFSKSTWAGQLPVEKMANSVNWLLETQADNWPLPPVGLPSPRVSGPQPTERPLRENMTAGGPVTSTVTYASAELTVWPCPCSETTSRFLPVPGRLIVSDAAGHWGSPYQPRRFHR